MTSPRPRHHHRRSRPAFTLIEVLVALTLFAIVIPIAMQGIDLSTRGATMAKRQTEAATLGEAQLADIVAQMQANLGGAIPSQGDFGPDFPGYRWTLQTNPREFDINELILAVQWQEQGRARTLNLSTMVYSSSGAAQ